MKQPKYKFGDKFTCKVRTEVMSNTVNVEIIGYVTAIMATSTAEGFCYKYNLSTSIPAAYYQPKIVIKNIQGSKLEQDWTYHEQ